MSHRIAALILNWHTPDATVFAAGAIETSERRVDQLIVIDNGSGDAADLQRRLPDATILESGSNLGFSGGCNLGIRRALADGADFVLLVNSDAVLAHDCLGHLMAAMEDHPALGIAGPVLLRSSDSRIESTGIRFSTVTGRVYSDGAGQAAGSQPPLRFVDAVSGCVMLIRRSLLEKVGLFADEYFYSFEDVDLCVRARHAGFLVGCVGPAVVVHSGSLSIGAHSPRRIYFATRNHLLLARRAAPDTPPLSRAARGAFIVMLNLAHVIVRSPTSLGPGLSAVARGTWDHLRGSYGPKA